MKKTGIFLMITGAIIILAALIFFPATYPLNAVNSETPTVTITGTGYFPWRVFAGAVLAAIGAVLHFADRTGRRQNGHLE